MKTRSSSSGRGGASAGGGRAPACAGPAFLLDYDGTLVPIRRAPDEATLPAGVRDLLARLGRAHFVAVVSGRSLAAIRRLVGLRALAYAGNHGFEIRAGGRTWVHPGARRARPALRAAIREIRRATRRVPGILVEDKGLTASVHLRRVPAGRRSAIRAAVEEAVRRRPSLRPARDKEVLEILPRIDWDKGDAVLKILELARLGKDVLPVYVGDDRTDESAFRALKGRGVTVRVGRAASTAASLRLPGVDAVRILLRLFLEAPAGGASHK